MTNRYVIERLLEVTDAHIQGLSDVLVDCVESGASVGFMSPITRERAVAFWSRVARTVAAGERALLIAKDELGICGTVQLNFDLPENQPHRADLAKMLVHRRVRRQGVGAALVRAAESTALACSKTLLVLDTVTDGDAARLYERLDWVRVGDVPDFALMPAGAPCSTTYYCRTLNPSVAPKTSAGQPCRASPGVPDRSTSSTSSASSTGNTGSRPADAAGLVSAPRSHQPDPTPNTTRRVHP